MTDHLPERLTGGLKSAAQSYFRADLGEILLHWGNWTGRYGAAAFAFGNHIFLPARSNLTPLETVELLGHELAHSLQQWQGRVRQTYFISGSPANDDPLLEQEAIAAGREFVRGGNSSFPHATLSRQCAPVMQCAIRIGNKPILSEADLTTSRPALGLIEDGASWLSWAIKTPSVNYQFDSERDFLAGMQSGQHGTQLMLLRALGLEVHPFKLLEMKPEDLAVLTAAVNETQANSVALMQAKKVLARYQLRSLDQLTIGTDLLSQAAIADEPVFQAMTLADRIALFNLVDGATSEVSLNKMIQEEAAQFSVQYAQSPSEFVDYYETYIATMGDDTPTQKGAPARKRKAQTAVESIKPLLYGNLFCPEVQGVPTTEALNTIIQNWVSTGNTLGFSRLSQALAQVVQFASLNGATGDAAARAIASFVSNAEAFVTQQEANSVTLSQDGQEYSYTWAGRQAIAQVGLDSDGNITLMSYQPKS